MQEQKLLSYSQVIIEILNNYKGDKILTAVHIKGYIKVLKENPTQMVEDPRTGRKMLVRDALMQKQALLTLLNQSIEHLEEFLELSKEESRFTSKEKSRLEASIAELLLFTGIMDKQQGEVTDVEANEVKEEKSDE